MSSPGSTTTCPSGVAQAAYAVGAPIGLVAPSTKPCRRSGECFGVAASSSPESAITKPVVSEVPGVAPATRSAPATNRRPARAIGATAATNCARLPAACAADDSGNSSSGTGGGSVIARA